MALKLVGVRTDMDGGRTVLEKWTDELGAYKIAFICASDEKVPEHDKMKHLEDVLQKMKDQNEDFFVVLTGKARKIHQGLKENDEREEWRGLFNVNGK